MTCIYIQINYPCSWTFLYHLNRLLSWCLCGVFFRDNVILFESQWTKWNEWTFLGIELDWWYKLVYGINNPYEFILIKNNLKLGLGVNRTKNKDLWKKKGRMVGSFQGGVGVDRHMQNREMDQENKLDSGRELAQTLLIYHF